jgi:two-component system sensor kinase FixL
MAGLRRNSRLQRSLLLHAIVENAPCAIIACNDSGIIIECNSAGLTMFGYKDEELLGQPLAMLMPEPHRSAHDDYMKAYHASGVSHVIGHTRVMEGVHRDGSAITLRLQVARHDGANGPIFVGVLEDLARLEEARRRLEADSASLDRASRRTAATVLASMVAHELNQPLAAASARLDAAELRLAGAKGSAEHEALRDVRVAAQEIRWAGSVIQRLRRSMGDEPPAKAPTDVNAVLRVAAYMASNETDIDHVALTLDLDETLPPLMMDRIQIQQALMNLVRNAIDAAREHDEPGRVALSTRREGDKVALRVTDNGPGLDPEIRRTLFTPFVSTKRDGLGLGLAITRMLVEANGGEIALEPHDPHGVEAVIRLPAA